MLGRQEVQILVEGGGVEVCVKRREEGEGGEGGGGGERVSGWGEGLLGGFGVVILKVDPFCVLGVVVFCGGNLDGRRVG